MKGLSKNSLRLSSSHSAPGGYRQPTQSVTDHTRVHIHHMPGKNLKNYICHEYTDLNVLSSGNNSVYLVFWLFRINYRQHGFVPG